MRNTILIKIVLNAFAVIRFLLLLFNRRLNLKSLKSMLYPLSFNISKKKKKV
jgi:hypothetical protein